MSGSTLNRPLFRFGILIEVFTDMVKRRGGGGRYLLVRITTCRNSHKPQLSQDLKPLKLRKHHHKVTIKLNEKRLLYTTRRRQIYEYTVKI